MNQNRRSFFVLVIMGLTLITFFVYMFIPKSEKKTRNLQRIITTLPNYMEEFCGEFREKIQVEISKIFKRETCLFDIEFKGDSLFANTIKEYHKVEMAVYTLFDLHFSILSKNKVNSEWIKDLGKIVGAEYIGLVDLKIMSKRFMVNRIAYNNNGYVIFIIFGNKIKNTELINKIFENVISFEKKDLIHRFKLIKLGYKIKEICND